MIISIVLLLIAATCFLSIWFLEDPADKHATDEQWSELMGLLTPFEDEEDGKVRDERHNYG
jgi:flagellar basal body-associated protein FliL